MCISTNKAPLFPLETWVPASLFSLTPVPRSRSKDHDNDHRWLSGCPGSVHLEALGSLLLVR